LRIRDVYPGSVFFKELKYFLSKKLVLSSEKQRLGILDPRYGIWIKPVPDPEAGSRVQKSTGSRIRIRNTDPLLELHQESSPKNFKRKKAKKNYGRYTVGYSMFLKKGRISFCFEIEVVQSFALPY
jgi:hypothetical protein